MSTETYSCGQNFCRAENEPRQADHTVAEMIERYIEEALLNNSRTERNQRPHLGWWKREIGACPLRRARPPLFVECRKKLLSEETHLGRCRSAATVNRYFATLSRVFSVAAKEWEWLESSPLRHLSKLKEPEGRTRFLSQRELRRLLAACRQSPNGDLYVAVVLALSTCARQMEIMSLRWEDIDLRNGLLFLHQTKNGTDRAVPLQGYALDLIKQRRRTHGRDTGLVFPGRRKPQQPINLRNPWEKVLAAADIKNFRWHDLRHTGASYLAMQGASLTELSDVLGHKTLQMVKRYAHLSLPHTIRIVADMNQAMFKEYLGRERKPGNSVARSSEPYDFRENK